MRFLITPELTSKLIPIRKTQLSRARWDEILAKHDAVVLSYGLGPALYLTMDGQIIVHAYLDEKEPYVSEDDNERCEAICIGAITLKLPALCELLPNSAIDCRLCHGSGLLKLGVDSKGNPGELVCWHCHGLGWSTGPLTPNA
jgi:hypothetical protein